VGCAIAFDCVFNSNAKFLVLIHFYDCWARLWFIYHICGTFSGSSNRIVHIDLIFTARSCCWLYGQNTCKNTRTRGIKHISHKWLFVKMQLMQSTAVGFSIGLCQCSKYCNSRGWCPCRTTTLYCIDACACIHVGTIHVRCAWHKLKTFQKTFGTLRVYEVQLPGKCCGKVCSSFQNRS
jgi:hypothetical protein